MNIYLRLVVACLLLWTGVKDVCGQTLLSYGTWGKTTVSTQIVNLTGNVTMEGTITVPAGVTLTIKGNSKTITTINYLYCQNLEKFHVSLFLNYQ